MGVKGHSLKKTICNIFCGEKILAKKISYLGREGGVGVFLKPCGKMHHKCKYCLLHLPSIIRYKSDVIYHVFHNYLPSQLNMSTKGNQLPRSLI